MNLPSWATIWTAVGALAAVVVLIIPVWKFLKRKISRKRIRIFLSMQMSDLSYEEYDEVRHDIMDLIYQLRKTNDVYFYNEFIQRPKDFDENKLDADNYLKEIKRCDYFIAILSEKIVSSIYFEAGYALALGKKSIYFVADEQVMPLLMRIAAHDYQDLQIVKATSIDEISPRIMNILNDYRISKNA